MLNRLYRRWKNEVAPAARSRDAGQLSIVRTDPFPLLRRAALILLAAAFPFLAATAARADILWAFTADMPAGWTELTGGSTALDAGSYLHAESTASPDGMQSFVTNLAGYTSVTITGRVATFGSGTARPLVVDISTNSGSTWAQAVTSATPSSSTYINTGVMTVTVPLNATTVFRLRSGGTSGRGVRMQNFSCNGTPPPVSSPPTVTTSAGTATNTTTATVGGNVTADGGATVTNRGVVYKTTAGVTIADNKTQSGSGTGTYTANLTSLAVNQQYFFRAYAQNSAGDGLGSELTFWTWANVPSAPTVDNPTTTTLDVNVNVNGNPASTVFSIQATNSSLFVQTNGTLGATEHWRTDAAWGTTTVTGLSPSQQYGFRVRAQNGQGTLTAYSTVANGTTSVGAVAPTVTTSAGSATGTTTATVGGNVTADGGAAVTNRGVAYKTTAGVTIADNKTQSGSGTGTFTVNLTSLSVNQQYYYRAYAQNSAGDGLGSELTFWTWANVPSAPTVGGATISSLNVTVNENGNPAATVFSIQATNSSLYVQTNGTLGAAEHWRTDAAWGTIAVTNLSPGQQYGFRVRAQNGQGTLTAYSTVGNGTTLATTPTVTTAVASVTNQTTASSGGNVTADGGAAVTNRGVVWALSPATPTVPGAQTTNGTGTGGFSSTLTNLMPGASYNYRAFAQNVEGTSYGTQYTLTTPCFGVVVTGVIASVTNSTDFTASWSNLVGATGYALDVSTSSTFSASGGYASDLFISEYIDGDSGNNKAIEIYNGTGASVDLSDYDVWIVANGGTWPESTIALSGTLADGDVYVVMNSGADFANLTSVDDLSTGSLTFNGDDAVGLAKNGVLIDAVGTDGADPGTGWAVAGTANATADRDLVRKSTVSGPNTDWDASRGTSTSDSEWILNGGDNAAASDFGAHTYSGGSAPSYVPGYSNLAVSGTSQSVSGLDQGVTYYFRVRATNVNCTTANSSTSSVTTLTLSPEISILGTNLALIDSGDVTPILADGTDFGLVSAAGSVAVTNTFSITNSGTATLTISGVTTSSAMGAAADFVVLNWPATVSAGTRSNLVIKFDPAATGLRTALVTVANNDGDEGTYSFVLKGTGTAPEIAVSGNGNAISDESTAPSTANHTDFGNVLVDGGSLTRTYTITNTGNENLTLGSVTTTGTHAAEFIVTTQPSSPVAPNGSATFIVEFNPNATGLRTAQVTFVTNDGDENPFNFTIQGTGTAPEIAVSGNGIDIADGDNTPSSTDGTDYGNVLIGNDLDQTFVITNTGNAALSLGTVTTSGTHAAEFVVISQPASPLGVSNSTTFVVRFTPAGSGLRTASLSFTNSDSGENPFNFDIQGTGVSAAPNMIMLGTNGATIVKDDPTPAVADGTDFGAANVVGGTVTRTFTITNSGTASLTISGITTSGTHAAEFQVTTAPGGSVAAGATTTFVITFTPDDRGLREATFSIANNDGPNNPYAFAVQGTGLAPEIAVSGNGNNIADGSVTPALSNLTDFGSADIAGGTVTRTFTVTNTGNASLTLGTVTTSGTHQAEFTVLTQPAGPLAVSNSTTFQVQFDPAATGTRSATLSFSNGDPDEDPSPSRLRARVSSIRK
jgi:hypothetical protein